METAGVQGPQLPTSSVEKQFADDEEAPAGLFDSVGLVDGRNLESVAERMKGFGFCCPLMQYYRYCWVDLLDFV